MTDSSISPPALFAWGWPGFITVAIAALPAALVAGLDDAHQGLTMLIGLIPAVAIGVAPRRRARVGVLVVAVLLPLGLLVGSALKEFAGPWPAAVGMAALALAAVAIWARSGRAIGAMLLVPVAGIGLSYDTTSTAVGMFVLMFTSSLVALAVSLFFPERPSGPRRTRAPLPAPIARPYAAQFAGAMGLATLAGFALDHTGWVVGSAGLVSRPSHEMQRFRSLWRVGAIFAGALAVSFFLLLRPNPWAAAIASAMSLAVAAGLHPSRAYVMPGFMTFSVFIMLEFPISSDVVVWGRFGERIGWVTAGVLIAYLMEALVPWVAGKVGARRVRSRP